jgi:O-antigen/teichoic acid export membrane protein
VRCDEAGGIESGVTRAQAMSASAVPVSFILANGLSYVLLLVAAHLMGPPDYGTLSSLLGLLLISAIPMLALQTVAARRAATDAGSAGIVRGTAVIGTIAAVVLVALSPLIALFLRLGTVIGILLVAATVPLNSILGTAMGVAQGRRQFRRLAALIVMATGGRSAGGLVGLVVGRSPHATLIGSLIGTAVAATMVATSGRPITAHRSSLRDRANAGVMIETVNAAYAHGTFLLLTSLDVLLARHVLSSSAAGVYAVGSVVTRAAVWLPQSVVTLMFASLADVATHGRTARRACAVVLSVGCVLVAGAAGLGTLVVTVVGGSRYHARDQHIWLFAMLGSLLAMLQLAMLAGLAQRTARRAGLLWLTVAADVIVVLATGDHVTPTRLVATLVTITAAAAVVGLWLTVRQPAVAAGQSAGV